MVHVTDLAFADPQLAAVYDAANPWCVSDTFYLGYVRSAVDVLDVGCGTGLLLAAAARAGHAGRLVGVDPAEAMLAQARRHPGVEWRRGTLPGLGLVAEVDLVVMTGHAFQVLLDDADVRAFLMAAHRALRPGGHLAFESRNPLVRPWERWTSERVQRVAGPDGQGVDVARRVDEVDGEFVTFTEIYTSALWTEPRVSHSTLRFLRAEELDARLTAAGFHVEERYGDWDRRPFTPASPEIITVATS